MSESSVPVAFLFSIHADTVTIPPVMVLGGPQGSRMIASVAGGTFEGPKAKGIVLGGAGGDWVTLRDDGSFRLDVRITLQADSGVVILCTYNGIGTSKPDGSMALRTAPTFEAPPGEYDWLNRIQAIAFGTVDGAGVHYEVYALE